MSSSKKHIKLVISIGGNGNYFVREGGAMLGGFTIIENADLFCEAYTNKFKKLGHSTEIIKFNLNTNK